MRRSAVASLLSIEDDPIMAQLICSLAQKAGFQTRTCGGKTCIDAYENFQPDVVVLDILMPEIDGFEVLQYLKNRQSTSRIVIISGSGVSFRHMAHGLAEGLKLPLEAIVTKPFKPDELLALFTRLHDSVCCRKSPSANSFRSGELA